MTDADARPPGDEQDADKFAVQVKIQRGQAEELLRREFDFGDHPSVTQNPDGSSGLVLFLSRVQIQTLEGEGYEVDVGQNMSARGRERLAEIGHGDRFEGGKVPPRGVGRKIRGGTSDRDGPS
jgi:hypothetical protein